MMPRRTRRTHRRATGPGVDGERLQRGQAALTGPVARGDAAAVAGHLRASARWIPNWRRAYRSVSLRTAQRAHAPKDVFEVLTTPGTGPK